MRLKISKETAVKLYPEAPEWFQKVLIENFGAGIFAPKTFEDLTTLEDCCNLTGETIPDELKKLLTNDEFCYKALKIITKAINMTDSVEWIPNYNDSSEKKWEVVCKLSSGSGFSDSRSTCLYVHTLCGSRLCFKDEKRSIYAFNQFSDYFKGYLKR